MMTSLSYWCVLLVLGVVGTCMGTGTFLKGNEVCKEQRLDILLLVDRSGSIKDDQWIQAKKFIHKLIDNFDPSINGNRVALSLFAKDIHPRWCYDTYPTKEELLKVASKLECKMEKKDTPLHDMDLMRQCRKGSTVTGAALDHAVMTINNTACGARDDAEKIVVVLTDGKSTETNQGKRETPPIMFNMKDHTDAMKATGATVVAVGVGHKATEPSSIEELKMIASPDKDNTPLFFSVNDFGSLGGYLDMITQAACEPVPTHGAHCVDDCRSNLRCENLTCRCDVLNSSLTWSPDDQKCKEPSDGGWSEWSESECSSDKGCGPGQMTRQRWCDNPKPFGGGKSCLGNSMEVTKCNAKPCPTTSSPPREVLPKTTPRTAIPPPPPSAQCDRQLDVVILVDKSHSHETTCDHSVDKLQWELVKYFIGDIIESLDVSHDGTLVALALFASQVHPRWCFDTHTNKDDILDAVTGLDCEMVPHNTSQPLEDQCREGHTATASALDYANTVLHTGQSCRARDGVKKVVLVIAKGKSTDIGQSSQVGIVYHLFKEQLTFDAAASQCKSKNFRLAMPKTAEQHDALEKYLMSHLGSGYHKVWIGMGDKTQEGVWRWLDGEKVTWSRWQPKQPNNWKEQDCGEVILGKKGRPGMEWSDDQCIKSKLKYFVCQEEKPTTSQSMEDTVSTLKATGATVVVVGVGGRANEADARHEFKMMSSRNKGDRPLHFSANHFYDLPDLKKNVADALCHTDPDINERCIDGCGANLLCVDGVCQCADGLMFSPTQRRCIECGQE